MIKSVMMGALFLAACSRSEGGGGTATGGATPAAAGGGAAPAAASGATASYPDTTDGLKQLVLDAAQATPERTKALNESLVLPNAEAWFVATFGEDAGKTAYADYAPMAARIGELSNVFAKTLSEGKSDVRAHKIEDSSHPEATGLQKDAMMAMKTKVALYKVEMVRPGEDLGTSIWNFVYVDGAFRFIGKTRVN